MRRKGLSLIELIVGMTILSITAGIMTLNGSAVGKRSAKREAERVRAYIAGHIHRANVSNRAFWMTVQEDSIDVKTGLDDVNTKQEASLEAGLGCKYTPFSKASDGYAEKTTLNLRYNYDNNDYSTYTLYRLIDLNSAVSLSTDKGGKFCITVTDASNHICNVIIGR